MVAKKKTTAQKATAKRSVAKKAAAKKTVAAKTVEAKATPVKKKRKVAKKKTTTVVRAAPQKIGGWWGNSFTNSRILIALASALGIAALFMGWLHFTETNGVHTYNIFFNGWDLTVLSSDMRELFNKSWQTFIPIITFALSIVALITMLLPAFGLRVNKIAMDAFVIILGITIFILAICFLFGTLDMELASGKFIKFLDIGFYVTIAASIIMILGGLRDATKN